MIPEKLNQVQNIMNSLVCEVTYSKDIYQPAIAYTHARTNELAGDIFKLFINDTDPELAKFLYIHECGHILYAHSKNMDKRMDKYMQAKLSAAYSKVKNVFPSKQDFFNTFTSVVFNIVMDFEVNSRMFNLEEWTYMQERPQIFLKDPTAKGFWPEDYNLPSGLTWNEYLNLILIDPMEFLSIFLISKQQKAEEGESEKSTYSQKEYEDFKKSLAERKLSKEELEELEKEGKDHSDATFGVPTGLDGKSRKSVSPVTIKFEVYESKKELVKAVRKLLKIKVLRPTRRDIMYNSNRRKLNTGVIVPKIIKEEVHTRARLFLLMDVSGSVDAALVNDFISTFKEVAPNYKDTRVISWTTRLIDDWNIMEENPQHYGGGTDIHLGIDYIQEKYSPSNKDVLFVISDFIDILEEWSDSLSVMRCKKYAINWKPDYEYSYNPGFAKILNYRKEN